MSDADSGYVPADGRDFGHEREVAVVRGVDNPLIPWIRQKTEGIPLQVYQLAKLKETVAYAKANSPFYRAHLGQIDDEDIKTIEDMKNLPFMDADNLTRSGSEMLCVRPDEIERIVTLRTSGTVGEPKRIYFTKEDQEQTIDFFHHGMQCVIGTNDRFLILLPCRTPGSVGDLLSQGLKRLGCEVHAFGMGEDLKEVLVYLRENRITSLVGNPVYVLKLAEMGKAQGQDINLASVLLSTDYVPDKLAGRLSDIWGCKVYEHYGMTEMGFEGGVFCQYLKGYHLREADFYFEIISPEGKALPDGTYGEIVFTTLTRRGMPLIRYRTGDIGRFYTQKCSCGDELRLMEKVKRRVDGAVCLKNGKQIWMNELDEVLFSYDGITDYQAQMIKGELNITVYVTTDTGQEQNLYDAVKRGVSGYAGMDVAVKFKKQEVLFKGPLIKRKFIVGHPIKSEDKISCMISIGISNSGLP